MRYINVVEMKLNQVLKSTGVSKMIHQIDNKNEWSFQQVLWQKLSWFLSYGYSQGKSTLKLNSSACEKYEY